MRHIIVCEANEDLIRSFSKEAIVVRTKDQNSVGHLARVVNEENKLHCVELTIDTNLSALEFHEDWKGIPLNLVAPKLGKFLDFVRVRPMLNELNVRVYLPAGEKETYTDIQLLSSLGIHSAVYFDERNVEWKEFTDLIYFAAYPKVPRATVEPIHHVIMNYEPTEELNFRSVYFNNPKKYLHVDKDFNIALTAEKLAQGEFIGSGQECLDDIENNDAYHSYFADRNKRFKSMNDCSACPAWRICGGFFEDRLEANPGCSEVFSDLIDAADMNYKKEEEKPEEVCQL